MFENLESLSCNNSELEELRNLLFSLSSTLSSFPDVCIGSKGVCFISGHTLLAMENTIMDISPSQEKEIPACIFDCFKK